jgi:DNA-binding MarR family transcriptional regulator
VAPRRKKSELIDELVREFRTSGNQDDAFDNLAAQRLGVNETDLHCLNIVENAGGITAGKLAVLSGLTTGAVTGVIDRLEHRGFARRVQDPEDRRRVRIEVTRAFHAHADKIWGPVRADWGRALAKFSNEELELITEFLRASNEVGRRHLDRVREMR